MRKKIKKKLIVKFLNYSLKMKENFLPKTIFDLKTELSKVFRIDKNEQIIYYKNNFEEYEILKSNQEILKILRLNEKATFYLRKKKQIEIHCEDSTFIFENCFEFEKIKVLQYFLSIELKENLLRNGDNQIWLTENKEEMDKNKKIEDYKTKFIELKLFYVTEIKFEGKIYKKKIIDPNFDNLKKILLEIPNIDFNKIKEENFIKLTNKTTNLNRKELQKNLSQKIFKNNENLEFSKIDPKISYEDLHENINNSVLLMNNKFKAISREKILINDNNGIYRYFNFIKYFKKIKKVVYFYFNFEDFYDFLNIELILNEIEKNNKEIDTICKEVISQFNKYDIFLDKSVLKDEIRKLKNNEKPCFKNINLFQKQKSNNFFKFYNPQMKYINLYNFQKKKLKAYNFDNYKNNKIYLNQELISTYEIKKEFKNDLQFLNDFINFEKLEINNPNLAINLLERDFNYNELIIEIFKSSKNLIFSKKNIEYRNIDEIANLNEKNFNFIIDSLDEELIIFNYKISSEFLQSLKIYSNKVLFKCIENLLWNKIINEKNENIKIFSIQSSKKSINDDIEEFKKIKKFFIEFIIKHFKKEFNSEINKINNEYKVKFERNEIEKLIDGKYNPEFLIKIIIEKEKFLNNYYQELYEELAENIELIKKKFEKNILNFIKEAQIVFELIPKILEKYNDENINLNISIMKKMLLFNKINVLFIDEININLKNLYFNKQISNPMLIFFLQEFIEKNYSINFDFFLSQFKEEDDIINETAEIYNQEYKIFNNYSEIMNFCLEKCPFCKKLCSNNNSNHKDHSIDEGHQLRGMGGYINIKQELSLKTCEEIKDEDIIIFKNKKYTWEELKENENFNWKIKNKSNEFVKNKLLKMWNKVGNKISQIFNSKFIKINSIQKEHGELMHFIFIIDSSCKNNNNFNYNINLLILF